MATDICRSGGRIWFLFKFLLANCFSIPSAISAHLLWAITWIGISIPLVSTWQRWESDRWRAVVQVESDILIPSEEKERLAKSLKEIQPGGFATLLGSLAVAACSFMLPSVKELF